MPDSVERVEAAPLTLRLPSGTQLAPEALLLAMGRPSNVATLKIENARRQLDGHEQLLATGISFPAAPPLRL